MAIELELKYDLPEYAVAAVRSHPLLASIPVSENWLENIYFDTPDGQLRARRWALRLRGCDGRWWQTLKGRGSAQAGLHSRSEWECAVADASLSLAAFDAAFGAGSADPMPADVRATLAQAIDQVRPQFSTDFQRRSWQVPADGGGSIEVCLDVGAVRVGDAHGNTLAQTPLCEIELEQQWCSVEALQALARQLQATLPITPSSISKAQRGIALLAKLTSKDRA